MLTVEAPAKLNLTLEVLARRRDGFHEIRSVIQAISLCDNLRLQPSQDVTFACNMPGWVAEESLMFRAVSRLQEVAGCSRGVVVEVDKRIPLMSGLGGDSSGAAAVLRGLDRLWELGLPGERLTELAAGLGSDVPFFLHGGTALIEGRGELVTPLPPMPHLWIVLVIPDVPRLPGKTKRLYDDLNANHYTSGRITDNLVEQLKANGEFVPYLLFNAFENVALAHFPDLVSCRELMLKAGATEVRLVGSGPALFTLFEDRTVAEELHHRLVQQGLKAHLAETMPAVEKSG